MIRRIMIFALLWAVVTVGVGFSTTAALLHTGRAVNEPGLFSAHGIVWKLIHDLSEKEE